jgi:hypothetical protein
MCDAKEVFQTWMTAYAKKDVEKIMGLYEKGCVYSEPCYPDKTYEDLEKWFKFDFSRSGPQPTWTYEIEKEYVGADLAVILSRWTGYTDAGKPEQAVVRRLLSIDVLKLGPAGWLIVRTINEPERCPPLPPAPMRKPPKKKKKAKNARPGNGKRR